MTSAMVDYFFRCDPFEINFHFLTATGYWPLKVKNKVWQGLFSVFSFLCSFSIISMLFIQLVDIYLLRNNPIKLTKNLCASSVTLGSIIKYLLLFYKIEEIESLHATLRGFLKSLTDPEEARIASKAAEKMSTTTKAFFGLAVPCILTWMLYPGLEGRSEYSVPFPYRLPTDDWSTPVYEILYVYQSMAMIGFLTIILSVDLIFNGMVIQVIAKFEMLIRRVNNIECELELNNKEDEEGMVKKLYDPVVTEQLQKKVKECVIFHQEILGEIRRIKEIYSTACFTHFLTAVTLIGVLIIDVIMISKGVQLQMLQRVTYVICGIFDTFLFCFFTTEMEEKSYNVHQAVHSTPWYRFSPKVRRNLLLISLRSSKPERIVAGHFFPLHLTTFLQFIKLTYNISALLYQTVHF